LKKKESGALAVNQTQQRYANALQKVPHTFSADGTIKYGSSVMLWNE
jgi:hypothetical protein